MTRGLPRFGFYTDEGWGYLRVLSFRLRWKPLHAPFFFSERYGYVRWYGLGPWRVRFERV